MLLPKLWFLSSKSGLKIYLVEYITRKMMLMPMLIVQEKEIKKNKKRERRELMTHTDIDLKI